MIQMRLQSRPVEIGNYASMHGRSSLGATCPWCGAYAIIYLWSFAGCGKKRCKCGAMFRNGPTVYSEKMVEISDPTSEPDGP